MRVWQFDIKSTIFQVELVQGAYIRNKNDLQLHTLYSIVIVPKVSNIAKEKREQERNKMKLNKLVIPYRGRCDRSMLLAAQATQRENPNKC